ncbi:DUF1707 SHOCT-like domain-containing protein [Nocardioides hwasunensis]|uniref:DUF1707 domain-containing protein n=1 Tax=Nocardioides hwasunensis TaxID=397258 RepID=A0ABR8MEZ2_9ACTN|nr:DUF1707 domain-containing protein [Nocardioides hwasunensis]MBD3914125.1 DUF1707 domain-containing protein [Nocardioides hwasunensis]
MAGPDMRARDSDRNEAIEVIETAWSDGQLAREEYDARTTKALTATTLGDLERLVRDLQEPGKKRVRASLTRLAEVRGRPAPTQTQVAMAEGLAGFARRFGTGVLVIAVTAFAVLVALPWLLRGSADPAEGTQSSAPVDLLTADGFRTFVEAVDDKTGSTLVFDAFVGSESYGAATVPADATSDRYVRWTWRDAGFVDGESTGRDEGAIRFDLSRIDADAVPGLVEQAGDLVDEPDTFTLTISPDPYDLERQCYRVMAGNRFSEYATITASCSGRVLKTDAP